VIDQLCKKFDKEFILLLAYQNINQGLWAMVLLSAQDYYKQYLYLDPGVMASYMSMLSVTWSIKILYGLISDNFPIMGSRRKSYIIMAGIIQFASMMSIFVLNISTGIAVALLIASTSMTIAFSNVVVDAILIN
jgi:hypothetical protein